MRLAGDSQVRATSNRKQHLVPNPDEEWNHKRCPWNPTNSWRVSSTFLEYPDQEAVGVIVGPECINGHHGVDDSGRNNDGRNHGIEMSGYIKAPRCRQEWNFAVLLQSHNPKMSTGCVQTSSVFDFYWTRQRRYVSTENRGPFCTTKQIPVPVGAAFRGSCPGLAIRQRRRQRCHRPV